MDFGELKNDKEFVTKSNNLQKALQNIDEQISAACDFPNYDDLSTEEKVKYDLYLSYSINSLFWMLCKLQAMESGTVSETTFYCLKINIQRLSFLFCRIKLKMKYLGFELPW